MSGLVPIQNIKQNNTAKDGDLLFLTKSLGVGILTTASKKGMLTDNDRESAIKSMVMLNKLGTEFGKLQAVHALTDITGFGLLGHLTEMAEGSNLTAEINFNTIPFIPGLDTYLEKACIPGGTGRNWKSYGHKISSINERTIQLLCDPQTSGGLLVAVDPEALDQYLALTSKAGAIPIGKMTAKRERLVMINV